MGVTDHMSEVEFDHHSEAYARGSWSQYQELRRRCPVAHSSAHGGFWVVTSYDEVAEVARDDETYSSENDLSNPARPGVNIPPPRTNYPALPIEMDPPQFLKYRRLLNPFFSPSTVKAWLPTIEKWTTLCIDAVIERGRFDIVLDLANPVPALFTCDFLGLPLEDWRNYAEPAHEAIYSPPATPERDRANRGWSWIFRSVLEVVEARRREPRDDVLSSLAHAEVDGQRLTDDEILSIARTLIAGGFDTTTALTANALRYLEQNRQARQRLIDDPDIMPLAVEEFLRYFTPTQALARTVTKDAVLGGQHLSAGDRVLISWASANHDPAVFDDPEEVILDRFPNRHTSFGLGAHRCLGSNFARAEIETMLRAVLRRMPDYQVLDDEAVRYPTIGIVNGWVKMPATFTPGPRVIPDQRLPELD